eukprot:6357618-Pyramimonas_sp.AAC.1
MPGDWDALSMPRRSSVGQNQRRDALCMPALPAVPGGRSVLLHTLDGVFCSTLPSTVIGLT